MTDLERKLNKLGILYFVLAALCIPASLVAPMVMMNGTAGAEPEARVPIIIFAMMGLIGSLLLTVCIVLVGQAIRKRRWRNYCFVVAILLCFSFPVGTALGAYTLILLNKPEIKVMFASLGTP